MSLEYQRYGRNKETLINNTYIDSGEYRRKFDAATDFPVVNKTLYDCAKTALRHRSGTVYEDMYWIDMDTGNVLLAVLDSDKERGIIYTDKMEKRIRRSDNVVTVHTHPGSMPPSVADFNSCYEHGYKMGFVACHDGKVFGYTANQKISQNLFDLYYAKYINSGDDEYNAQFSAIKRIAENYDIDFWEVK